MKKKRIVKMNVTEPFRRKFKREAIDRGFKGIQDYSDYLSKCGTEVVRDWQPIKTKKKERKKDFGIF